MVDGLEEASQAAVRYQEFDVLVTENILFSKVVPLILDLGISLMSDIYASAMIDDHITNQAQAKAIPPEQISNHIIRPPQGPPLEGTYP